MEEINYGIPSWLKPKLIAALKSAGKTAAIHLCREYISDSIACDIGVGVLTKVAFPKKKK